MMLCTVTDELAARIQQRIAAHVRVDECDPFSSFSKVLQN